MTNRYDWRPYFSICRCRWLERRLVGSVAPNGDLTDYWEYRSPRKGAAVAQAFIVILKAVLMEHEGHPHYVAVYLDREKAQQWVNAQGREYFRPSDYWIAETELKE